MRIATGIGVLGSALAIFGTTMSMFAGSPGATSVIEVRCRSIPKPSRPINVSVFAPARSLVATNWVICTLRVRDKACSPTRSCATGVPLIRTLRDRSAGPLTRKLCVRDATTPVSGTSKKPIVGSNVSTSCSSVACARAAFVDATSVDVFSCTVSPMIWVDVAAPASDRAVTVRRPS